jgi:uncharacterized membrane protein YdbT with pleckstrin-like domain
MDRDEDTFGGEIVAVVTPATQLVLAYLVLTLAIGGALGAYLYTNPDLFGDQGYARLTGLVVLGLTVIGVIRLAIKYVVLYRTKYIVTPDSVRRQYQLAYREESRELPLHMIRGVELSRGRLQALLGFATIRFLAVGSNRGIGYVEFDNAADPETLQTAVLELLENQPENAPGTQTDDASPSSTTGAGTPAATATTSTQRNQGRQRTATTDAAQGSNDDPLGDDDSGRARRPVSGNDDARQSAEPDAGNN